MSTDSPVCGIVVGCNHKALIRKERKIDETSNFQRSKLILNPSQGATLLDK